MKRYAVVLALTVLALPGCKQETKPTKATGGTAAGEILPGSASDAMIPVDALRSQPPAAPKNESSGSDKAKGKQASPTAAAAKAAPTEQTPADRTQPEG